MTCFVQAGKYALLAVAAVFIWQSVNVRFNYGGEWNALFQSGDRFEIPAVLTAERIPQLADSDGYDGQFYHYIAHDPLMTKGMAVFVDDPGLRWRRILVPGLAALLSFGRPEWVDGAYLLVVYLCLACGVFWLSSLAMSFGRSAAWGLTFVAVPATAISIERLTVDIALAALIVGYCSYAVRGRSELAWLMLALAPLARETGLALLAVHGASAYFTRRWRELAAAVGCGLPFLAWALYVASVRPPLSSGWLGLPLAGLVVRSLDVFPRQSSGSQALVADLLDYAGVIGVWVALAQTVILLAQRLKRGFHWLGESMGPLEWGVLFFAASAIAIASPMVWAGSYAFGRVLSPWLIFLLLVATRDRRPWFAAPVVLLSLHAAAQAAVHVVGIARQAFDT